MEVEHVMTGGQNLSNETFNIYYCFNTVPQVRLTSLLHLGIGGRGGSPLSFLPEPANKKITLNRVV